MARKDKASATEWQYATSQRIRPKRLAQGTSGYEVPLLEAARGQGANAYGHTNRAKSQRLKVHSRSTRGLADCPVAFLRIELESCEQISLFHGEVLDVILGEGLLSEEVGRCTDNVPGEVRSQADTDLMMLDVGVPSAGAARSVNYLLIF